MVIIFGDDWLFLYFWVFLHIVAADAGILQWKGQYDIHVISVYFGEWWQQSKINELYSIVLYSILFYYIL